MGKQYDTIEPAIATFISAQRIFFVGTAPLSGDGHVNVSPKGGDSFRVLGPREAVYQDYTGSGVETVAHVRENGRIVVMFCAFAGPPKIVRLHGTASVVVPRDDRFEAMRSRFPDNPGTRSFVHIAVSRVSDSCGWSVPEYEFERERDNLDRWSASKGREGIAEYWVEKNQQSIDGIAGMG
jgi:hypothetical protein